MLFKGHPRTWEVWLWLSLLWIPYQAMAVLLSQSWHIFGIAFLGLTAHVCRIRPKPLPQGSAKRLAVEYLPTVNLISSSLFYVLYPSETILLPGLLYSYFWFCSWVFCAAGSTAQKGVLLIPCTFIFFLLISTSGGLAPVLFHVMLFFHFTMAVKFLLNHLDFIPAALFFGAYVSAGDTFIQDWNATLRREIAKYYRIPWKNSVRIQHPGGSLTLLSDSLWDRAEIVRGSGNFILGDGVELEAHPFQKPRQVRLCSSSGCMEPEISGFVDVYVRNHRAWLISTDPADLTAIQLDWKEQRILERWNFTKPGLFPVPSEEGLIMPVIPVGQQKHGWKLVPVNLYQEDLTDPVLQSKPAQDFTP